MDPVQGGVCKAVQTIATSLLQAGIDNEVVSLDDTNVNFLKEEPFKIHALGSANNPWGYNSELVPWLRANLVNYNVVVVHGLWLYISYAVYKAFKSFQKQTNLETIAKYYVMPHGMLDPYFQKAKERRLKAIRNILYWKLVESKVVNNANGLLFTCEEEQQLAKLPFKPYSPKSETIVGLGVEQPPEYEKKMDTVFFKQCPDFKSRPFLLFLSRIHEKKGVDLLLNAYEFLISKKDKLNVEIELPGLVIAGPGLDSEYGKKMRKKVLESSVLKHNVNFPGMLSGDVKWGAFYNCDAFVLPSHQENFGIAIVEAMACSKPVLISNKINIWKEISDNGGGIVGDDSLSGTTNIIEKWLNFSSIKKKQMEKDAQKVYQTHFALDAIIKNWKEKILKRTVKK